MINSDYPEGISILDPAKNITGTSVENLHHMFSTLKKGEAETRTSFISMDIRKAFILFSHNLQSQNSLNVE